MWKAARTAVLAVLPLGAGALAGSQEDLLEILDLHEKLATNEAFQQQAKMLGVYLEEARTMGPEEKAIVHRKVLTILQRIAAAPAPEPAAPSRPVPAEVLGPRVEKGVATLEFFKTETFDVIPESPVRRAPWRRDLAIAALGDDAHLPAKGDPTLVARVSFYLYVEAPGQHEFTVAHGGNEVRLLLGGRLIVDDTKGAKKTGPGMVELEHGYHRIDLLLRYADDPSFSVSLLRPGGSERQIIPQSDLFVKKAPTE